MKAAAGLVLALAIAAPVAAHGEAMQPRTTGLPASAIAAGQHSANALDEGRMLLAGNNPAQAISAFRIALAQAPQSVAALNGLAVAYDRLGRADLARRHFEMALALEPDAADIAYNLGLSLVHAGQDRAAIAHLQRAAAGTDARARAAARRTLAQVAARLTTPAAPTLSVVANAGPRIDIASSGEAVLVLAPSPARATPAAPQTALAQAPASPAATTLATMEPALATRLGDMAALTIPMALPAAAPAPADTATDAIVSATPDHRPNPASRREAGRASAPEAPALPEGPLPAQPPHLAELALASAPRQPATATLLVHWRRAAAAARLQTGDQYETPLPPPSPDDDKAAIRLAIARLETLVDMIEVQGG